MKTALALAGFWLSLFTGSAAENFVRLGIVLCCETNKGNPRIEAVLPHSPASRAGIRSGLVITSIDGFKTERMTMAECVRLLRGQADTSVVLECADPLKGHTNKFTVTRFRNKDEAK